MDSGVIVQFLDLKPAYDELKIELDQAYHRVMESGWYVLGTEVHSFEAEFASYCGSKYCVGVSNGLDALRLLLMAHDIGHGDEVIVPSNTYIASWLAVSQTGANPVPVEPHENTMNIDPCLIEAAITNRTKAVMAVHLYGQSADMTPIMEVAGKYGLVVIEDAAQAHGATYARTRTGALGHSAGFSFYPGKNLGAFGEAGAITTDDENVMSCVHMLRNYGSRKKYFNETKGFNFRLDELQAAFLRVKLKKLDHWNDRRSVIAKRYLKEFSSIDNLRLPAVLPVCESVWHQFVVRHPQRDALRSHLHSNGIGTMIHYPVPPHLSGAYSEDQPWPDLPASEAMAQTSLSLPVWPHMSDEMVDLVIDAVKEFPT